MGDRTGQTVQLGDPNSGHNVVLTADYDYNGNRTKLSANVGGTLNSNGTVSNGTPDFTNGYSFDNLGNMTAIAQTAQSGYNPNGVASKYVSLGYDPDSRLTGVSYSVLVAGVTTVVAGSTYGYDHASRLTDLSYVDGANNPNTLASYHWSYDTDSRVTDFYSRSDTNTTQSTPTSSYTTWAHTQYTYDHDSQLTSTTYSTFANAPTADTNSSPSYDANGNRTNNGAAGTGNRLLSDGTYDYTYDPDGNRIAQTTTSGTIYVYGAFQYNNDNQLTQVGSSLAQGCINYAYDPFGRMVSRHNVSGGGTQNYICDGQDIVLVLNASGQVIARNLYGPAVDQVLATETVTPGNSPQAAGPVNWYLTDNQGTVRDEVQFNGTATIEIDHLVYDAFGQITWQSSATNQPTFTSYGLWQDPTTAIDKTATRWYTAVDAVFLSQDPLGFLSGQTNLSEYCGNSPTNWIDPNGEQAGKQRGQEPQGGDQTGQNGSSDFWQRVKKEFEDERIPSDDAERLRNAWEFAQKEYANWWNQQPQSLTPVFRGMESYLSGVAESAESLLIGAIGLTVGGSGSGGPIPTAQIPGRQKTWEEQWGPLDLAGSQTGSLLNWSEIVNPSSPIIPRDLQDLASHFGYLPAGGLDSRFGFKINFNIAPINRNATIWVGTNLPTAQLIDGRPTIGMTPLGQPAITLGVPTSPGK